MKLKHILPIVLALTLLSAGNTNPVFGAPVPAETKKTGSLPVKGHEAVPLSGIYTPDAINDILSDTLDAEPLVPNSAFPASHDDPALLKTLRSMYPAVRNQNPYGSCWAFASIGAAEQNLIIEHGKNTDIDLSEAHLVHYVYNTAANPALSPAHAQDGDYIEHKKLDEEDLLDKGGHNIIAAETMAHWKGPVEESVAPYKKSPIQNWDNIDPFANAGYVQTGWRAISLKNPDLIKAWIREHGGVGVAYHEDSEYFDDSHNSYYCDDSAQETHSVMIVGWDDSFPRENFCTKAPRDGAWLIRNSWGKDKLDEDGYFWLSYSDKSLGGTTGAVYGQEYAKKTADNNYFYDCNFHEWHGASGTAANIFEISVNEAEELDSIGFLFLLVDPESGENAVRPGEATVMVYANPKEDNPVSGEKLFEKSGIELPCSGRYTVSLEEAPVLDMGETFSVIVSVTNGYVCQETDFTYWPGLNGRVSGNRGESFCLTDDGLWEDCGENGNICISAQTKNVAGELKEITSVFLPGTDYYYIGAAVTPSVAVYSGTQKLTEGTHYELKYENNIEPGTATVTVTGIGRCFGTITSEYRIIRADFAYGNGYKPMDPTETTHTVDLGNDISLTVTYLNAADYTGEKIRPVGSLGAKTDLSALEEKLPNAKNHLKVSYIYYAKNAGSNASFYPKLTVIKKGLSKNKAEMLQKTVKNLNKKLKEDPCLFTINRRSLLDGTVKIRLKTTKKGEPKVKTIRFIYPDTGRIVKLKDTDVYFDILDLSTRACLITAKEQNYSGVVTAFAKG